MTAMTEPLAVREAIDNLFGGDPGARLDVLRVGDREPVDTWVRRAVFLRDGARCRWCGASADGRQLVLDHIVPWSAGGSDRSENLRMLCWDCNATRSNFRTDAAIARAIPVSDGCTRCVDDEGWPMDPADEDDEDAPPCWVAVDPVVAFCGVCRFEGVTERMWTV